MEEVACAMEREREIMAEGIRRLHMTGEAIINASPSWHWKEIQFDDGDVVEMLYQVPAKVSQPTQRDLAQITFTVPKVVQVKADILIRRRRRAHLLALSRLGFPVKCYTL